MTTLVIAVYLMTSSAIVEVVAPSFTACVERQAAVSQGHDNIFHGADGVEIIQEVLACKIEQVNTGDDLSA